jgi:hypothetical protein
MWLARCSIALICLFGFTTFALADDAKPKYTIEQARKVALERVPGRVVREKLKTKTKGPVYSFRIKPTDTALGPQRVEVDGNTNTVVKVKPAKHRDKSQKYKEKDKDKKDDE